MVFVELVTDSFRENVRRGVADSERRRRSGTGRARRPLRGLEVKDDTYGILKVISADGAEIPLVDSSSETGESTEYANFILQSVVETRLEKHQIVDTFGEAYIFFFGEAPRFLDVRAILINSQDFNWEAEFWENYHRYFRGTKLVEMGARTYLFYDDTIVEGYMLQATAQKVSDMPLSVELGFRLFLTNYSNISFVGDPNFPIRASINLPPDVSLTQADAFEVGQAAVRAASDAARSEAAAYQAALGQAQQAGGFGGADKLSSALRSGLAPAADTSGITRNALAALFGGDAKGHSDRVRHAPLRGKIADNIDEYTAPPPPKNSQGTESPGSLAEAPRDLPATLTQQASPWGAILNSPDAHRQLGLGPTFLGGGAFAGAALGATFGATAFAGISLSLGAFAGAGVAGGVVGAPLGATPLGAPGSSSVPTGFVRGFAPGSGYAGAFGSVGLGLGGGGISRVGPVPQNFLGTPAGFGNAGQAAIGVPPFGAPGHGSPGYPPPSYAAPAYPVASSGFSGPAYVGGVQVGGGIAGGVGIGGGIGTGPSGSPGVGPFGAFTGATSFRGAPALGSAQGASVVVGGTPTCFAVVSVPGTLNTVPSAGLFASTSHVWVR